MIGQRGFVPPTLRLGAREVPAFRSIGIAGYYLAVLTALLAAFRTGLNPVIALGISAVAAASFFGWAGLRRAVTGQERLVLLEHVWVAAGTVWGFCLLARAGSPSPRPWTTSR